MRLTLTTIFFVAFSFVFWGCGDDTTSSGTDTNTAADSGSSADVVAPDQTAVSGLACLPAGVTISGTETIVEDCSLDSSPVGKSYLVDSLLVTEPANDALLSQLNTLWASDIESGKLILIFHIVERDNDTGTSTILVGSGKMENDIYTWEGEPATVSLSVSQCNYETSEPANLTLAPASVNKPIVMTDVDVCGQFSADATRLPFSFLAGSIREADASGVEVSINPDAPDFTVDLAELLGSFVDLDTDTDGDGSADAWALKGTLTGQEITNFNAN